MPKNHTEDSALLNLLERILKSEILITISLLISGCGVRFIEPSISPEAEVTSSTTTTSSTATNNSYSALTVTKYFTSVDDKWNAYAKADDSAACVGTETPYTACTHAGEYRKVVTDLKSCSGLGMTDAHSWLTWTCSVVGGYATFVGSFANPSAIRLRNLLNTTSVPVFNTNYVTLTGCTNCPRSGTASTWWSNTVSQIVPDINVQATLNTAYGIYYLPENSIIYGIEITAEGVAIAGGEAATYDDSQFGWCDPNSGGGGGGAYCAITSETNFFIWIEGSYVNAGIQPAAYNVLLRSSNFSRLAGLTLSGTSTGLKLLSSISMTSYGLNISTSGNVVVGPTGYYALGLTASSQYNYFSDSTLSTSGADSAISVEAGSNSNTFKTAVITGSSNFGNAFNVASDDNIFDALRVSSWASFTGSFGVQALAISGNSNTVKNSRFSNNFYQTAYGLYINGNSNKIYNSHFNNNFYPIFVTGDSNSLSHLTLSHNDSGLYITTGANNNKVSGITVVNTSNASIFANSTGHHNILHNMSLSGNGSAASITTHYNTFSQIAFGQHTANSNYWTSSAASYNKYTGNFITPDNSGLIPPNNISCSVTGGTNPGITHSTCANEGSSDASVFQNSYNMLGNFRGSVTSDSTNTAEDVSGQALFTTIDTIQLRWYSFDNIFRTWGKLASAVGRCLTGASCQMYDWSAKTTGDLYDRTNSVTTVNSTTSTGSYVFPTGACPTEVDGNNTLTTIAGCSDGSSANSGACTGGGGTWYAAETYLKNAIEIIVDSPGLDAGDHDGLCESGEDCLYTPNFGSYQGHSTLQQCTFSNGTITGVAMYGYSVNGY